MRRPWTLCDLSGRVYGRKNIWDKEIKEWDEVVRDAKRDGEEIHLGRLFGICVEKGSELPEGGS